MIRKLNKFIIILVLLMSTLTAAADDFTLKGKVIDEDGHALELVTISCAAQGKLTMTNLKGEFSIGLSTADSVVVKFTMVGYGVRKRVFKRPKGKMTVQIVMHPAATLSEVTVTQRRRQTSQTEQLDTKHLKQTPSTTGNAVEEMIQQQAGVSSHNELSSQYNVRGGSFDENSVYINQIEVYRPLLISSGQQEGLSVINPNMVEKIGFSTGGYEAKYGDKMSSVLDITYRRIKGFEANATASLLGASGFIGYGNSRFSMSHGIRYKTNRYLLNTLETTGEYKPNFLDYQTYISYTPNKRWNIDFIGNIADNHYNFTPKDRETSFGTLADVKQFKVYFDGQEKDRFNTLFGALGITRRITDSTSVKFLTSAFHTKERETYDIAGQYWLNDTQTQESLGVGTYMEHARNYLSADVINFKLIVRHQTRRHDIEAGISYKTEHIKEQSREYEMRDSSGYSIPHSADKLNLIYTLNAKNDIRSNRIEAYIQDVYRWAKGNNYFTLNYGVRIANWSYNKETTVSPRASLAIVPAFDSDLTFRFATGLYYQAPFYKEMRDTTTVNGITTAALNNHIKSQQSIHFIAAADYRFRMLNRPFKFTAEAYYKALNNLIPYNVQNMKITYYGENLTKGYATGIDLKLYGEFVPGTDSWLTLSLMSTRQKFNNQWIPLPTDQRWAVNLHFTDYFPGTERWKMTLRLAFADGLPFGAPHRGLEQQQFRAPAYKRADISMSYCALKNTKGIKGIWLGIDCLNLFGISNVNSYYWVTDVSNTQWAVPNFLTNRQINGKITINL
ncbi:Outer membrane receptor proteins, mostly Fe transport [Xylanibacter ruminicola]|uniref:Outer membrane receptor proteins, mostly Fe transport n=1 Tax=Xylanibacter ruminicola TaxID=839 RepID=A0A1M7DX57_XYLRU|nr:carboxypeptidase-like regulatory domain-containing protein [Xylanibacter ruminicola]SHL83983.1 Outer membrane receptor proteins, mostly Fe transport [Xylanibacter ruminicola]